MLTMISGFRLEVDAGDGAGGDAGGDATALAGGDAAGGGGDWLTGVDDTIRDDPSMAGLSNVGDLAKKMITAQALVGNDKIALLGENATDEQKSTFFNKLGRPEKSDGYEFPTDGLPEGAALSDDVLKAFSETAHRLGLTKQQAAGLYRWQLEASHEAQEAHDADHESAMGEATENLKKEFGKAYEQNIDMAKVLIKKHMGDEFSEFLDESGLGNDTRFIKGIVNLAKSIQNDEIIGTGGGTSFVMSPSEANAEIGRLKADTDFMKAYTNSREPGHTEANEKMKHLFELANPEPGE